MADPQSLFEEKESLEEKLAVREYELRLAQEDIVNLKTELLKKAETNCDEPRGKALKLQVYSQAQLMVMFIVHMKMIVMLIFRYCKIHTCA